MRDNKDKQKILLRKPERKEVFPAKTKDKITRKESREHLAYFNLACELAKVVLHEKIHVSILTEFIENETREVDKQDCKREGAKRLMQRLIKEFPMLQICICGDSLYASEGFFKECRRKKWKYILLARAAGDVYHIENPFHSGIIILWCMNR